MFPIIFQLGPLTLHSYGLCVALGFLLGFFWLKKEFQRAQYPETYLDPLVSWMMLSALLGARVFYMATDSFESLRQDPLSFFRIWEGGLVYYGGFIGAIVVLILFSHRKKIPFLELADVFVGPLLLAQAFGRLGCFFAGCCYGKVFDGWSCVTFHNPHSLAPLGIPLHATQLYEVAGLIFLISLLLFMKKFNFDGVIGRRVAFYFVGYGSLRFSVEIFRGDFRGAQPLGFSPGQWISLVGLLLGVVLIIYGKKRKELSQSN